MVGKGITPFHFSNIEIKILDLDPPINAISHYGACHFTYNLALTLPPLISLPLKDGREDGEREIVFLIRLFSYFMMSDLGEIYEYTRAKFELILAII